MKTTLNKILAHYPCTDGWSKLLGNLGKTKPDNEPLAITTILDSNGLEDALWCLRAVDGHQSEMRLYAVDCARSVQHLMKDPRSIAAIDTAERHAYGLATDEELAAACDAARDAASSAAWAAARDAAWAAARDAAWDTARYTARYTARAPARAAAWAAAWAASEAAAWAAAWAASEAAAWDAAEEVQSDLLRIVCAEIEQRDEVL